VAVSRIRHFGNSGTVIDVVPLGPGVWLARCECDVTERFPDAASGWEWVLSHPCQPQPAENVVDLTPASESCVDGRR
jgi:hypothetical protein